MTAEPCRPPKPRVTMLAQLALALGIASWIIYFAAVSASSSAWTIIIALLVPMFCAAAGLAVILKTMIGYGTWKDDVAACAGILFASVVLFGMLYSGRAQLWNPDRDATKLATCASHMFDIQMIVSMQAYCEAKALPVSLAAAVSSRQQTFQMSREEPEPMSEALLCPATKHKPVPGQFQTDYDSIMDMLGIPLPVVEMRNTIPFIWDKDSYHKGGRNVGFWSGQVRYMDEPSFRQLMEQTKAWVAEMKQKHPPGQHPATVTAPASATPPASSTSP